MIDTEITQLYSREQVFAMKLKISEAMSFKDLVSSRTTVERSGDWYAVRCEFHSTNTTDAGRLKTNQGKEFGTYFCNNPDCQVRHFSDSPLNMFQYWQLANNLQSETQAVLSMYTDLLGLPLPKPEGKVLTEEEIKKLEKEKRQNLLMMYAVFFWHKFLFDEKYPDGLDYLLNERKIPLELIKKYYIGFAPNGGALSTELIKVGFKEEEIKEAKLMSQNGKDLYWGRIIVPLVDNMYNPLDPNFDIRNSKIPNVYSRMLPKYIKDERAKSFKHRYLNNKFPLFNYAEARKKKIAIMPEGCMDTMAGQEFILKLVELEKSGQLPDWATIKPSELGIFASYGTNGFSEKVHLPLFKSANFHTLYIAGDNDKNFAGQVANIKRAKVIKEAYPNINIRIVIWPDKDLNDLLVSGTNPLEFLKALEKSVSLEEYIILTELQKCGDLSTVRNQFEAINNISELVSSLDLTTTDNILKYRRTLKFICNKLELDMETLLLQCFLAASKEKMKKEAEANNVSLESMLYLKVIELTNTL